VVWFEKATRKVKEIKKAAIIGGTGNMGRLLAEGSERSGVETVRLGRPLTRDKLEPAFDRADLVFLSVPASAVERVLETVGPLLRPEQILADNVSVKMAPISAMLGGHQGPVVGTHPLFGPNPPERARVAVVAGRDKDGTATPAVERWFEAMGYECFRTTAEAHDKAAAQIQSLNFITTVSYLAALSHQEEIMDFLTPSFHRRLDAARKMIMEDGELFAGFFEANPFGQDAVRRFRNFLHVAAGGDIDILLERARWWWSAAQDRDPS